jgi:hypothetical protein
MQTYREKSHLVAELEFDLPLGERRKKVVIFLIVVVS